MSDIRKKGFLRRDVLQGTAIAGLATIASVKNLAAAPSETNEALAPQPTPLPGNNLNTSDILVETLIDWGATHVFGIVGDGINSIIEALRKRQDRIRYIGVRHEEAAAFMAAGFAKHTGTPWRLCRNDRPGRDPFDERPVRGGARRRRSSPSPGSPSTIYAACAFSRASIP